MHLAQINIGRIRAPLEDPIMAGFVTNLDEINALAERTPGFVWRLVGDGNNATSLRPFDDPMMLLNMSVWESLEALRGYVYRSDHARFVRARLDWFEKMEGPVYALWWIPVGHVPTVQEAIERLEYLRVNGPSDKAFWFPRPSPRPEGRNDLREP